MGTVIKSRDLYERLSDEAQLTIQGARQQAIQLESGAIGTEHLLLSLLVEGDGAARKTLEMLGIDRESVRQRLLAVAIPRPVPGRTMALSKSEEGLVPFTTEANKVVERSSREALKLGHGYLGAEHMLLALIRERDGLAARVLVGMGADLGTARRYVAVLVEEDGVPAGIEPEWAHVEPPARGLSRWRGKQSK
jgi:ATP-dependent Clp protease ATP-binding subunit ClpC